MSDFVSKCQVDSSREMIQGLSHDHCRHADKSACELLHLREPIHMERHRHTQEFGTDKVQRYSSCLVHSAGFDFQHFK